MIVYARITVKQREKRKNAQIDAGCRMQNAEGSLRGKGKKEAKGECR